MTAATAAIVVSSAESAPGVPQLRTILLTDLVDSTGWVERLGDGPAAELFRAHDRLVLQLQERWRGRLIDRSDGMLLLFERPIDGLGFAIDYNRGLRELGEPHGAELTARAGLHVGEVLTWRNSDEAVRVGAKPLEIEGLAKPMAARLMTMARPGQILLSAVAEPLAHRAARELGERGQHLLWKSHGRWRFKGVPQPQQIFEVGEPGIAPLRAPPSSPKAWRDIPLWRRPAALAAEAAVVAVIAIGLWFFMRPQPAIAFNERDWVVLADLRNLTGEPLLDDSLEQAFRISLEQSRHVNVLGDIKARKTLSRMAREPEDGLDRAVASELAIRDGARAVILPTVSEVGGRVRVSAEVIDPSTETTVYVAYADGRGTESVLESIDEVTATLREQLGEALEHVNEDSVPLPEVTTKNLDALKAYALAQEAEANRRWEEAIDLYQQAIELDAEFALAHMGMARILWSSIDYPAAQPHVDRAWELRESLPPRDRLYLDAWRAETAPEGTPLEEWTLLASMYPDYFAGSSNASWYLIVENRFEEALPYARAAAVPQDPLRAYPLDHVGRIHLAMGRPEEGLASFLLSEKESGGGAIRYRADALAVLGRHAEAREVLKSIKVEPSRPSSLYSHLERISIPLELGEFDEATGQAGVAVRDASVAGGSQPEHFGLVRQMVALASGNREVSVVELERLADLAESRLMDAQGPRQHSHVFRMLVAAYVAQRSGHRKLAMDLTGKAEPHVRRLQHPNLHRMFGIVRGTSVRLEGRPEDAIAILKEQVDGTEFVQTHVALHSAYIAAGRTAEAAAEAAWLSEHVGRAYVEVNMDQILQPLNVADVAKARGSGS